MSGKIQLAGAAAAKEFYQIDGWEDARQGLESLAGRVAIDRGQRAPKAYCWP